MTPEQFQKLQSLAQELGAAKLIEGVILLTLCGNICAGVSNQPIGDLCANIASQILRDIS